MPARISQSEPVFGACEGAGASHEGCEMMFAVCGADVLRAKASMMLPRAGTGVGERVRCRTSSAWRCCRCLR